MTFSLNPGVALKIADFGIAKITSTQQLTRTGMVMGTPSYMSPEQITAQHLDGRADQFSLAVIAFELLAVGSPFRRTHCPGWYTRSFMRSGLPHGRRARICPSRRMWF
jgi:serine/threonine protein kinase